MAQFPFLGMQVGIYSEWACEERNAFDSLSVLLVPCFYLKLKRYQSNFSATPLTGVKSEMTCT